LVTGSLQTHRTLLGAQSIVAAARAIASDDPCAIES
jgi:hypothetical protein